MNEKCYKKHNILNFYAIMKVYRIIYISIIFCNTMYDCELFHLIVKNFTTSNQDHTGETEYQ